MSTSIRKDSIGKEAKAFRTVHTLRVDLPNDAKNVEVSASGHLKFSIICKQTGHAEFVGFVDFATYKVELQELILAEGRFLFLESLESMLMPFDVYVRVT